MENVKVGDESTRRMLLGPRPIDLHIKGFEALGAKVEFVDGAHVITADRLVGAKYI